MLNKMSDAIAKSNNLKICVVCPFINEKGEVEAEKKNAKKFLADFTDSIEIPVNTYRIERNKKGKITKRVSEKSGKVLFDSNKVKVSNKIAKSKSEK